MPDTIRWGILGTGSIAGAFAHALSLLPEAMLVAVGSRQQSTADSFAHRYGVARAYSTYEALVADPEIDVIYISTPHNLHYANTLLCLEAGKAVLCEKPFAINAKQSAEMIALARRKNLFLMEAMWTRFLPAVVKLRDIIAAGTIGEIRLFQADFGFDAEFDPQSRLFNPALAGGALLDVGIYPVSFASMLLGTPLEMTSQALLGSTGVDELCAATLKYQGGQIAQVSASLRLDSPREALVMGTHGFVRVHRDFFHAQKLTLSVIGREDETLELPTEGSGFMYEAREVMACLRAGKRESTVMPLEETLTIMQTLDAIRAPWGLKYPDEE